MAKRIRLKTDDPKAFAAALRHEADVLFPRYIKLTVGELVARFYEGVVTDTPVLTGRARVNWHLSLSAPVRRSIDGKQLVQEPGHWFTRTGEPLTSAERAVLRGMREALLAAPLGRKVYLANNLAYIGLLEHGGSAKAPAGMVEINIDWVTGTGQRLAIARAAKAQL